MSPIVENESTVMAEALAILMEPMPASRVARLLASWQVGQGDYVAMRDSLFFGETVDSLCEEVALREQSKG